MPIYKNSEKEDLGNHRPGSLNSVSEKTMEQVLMIGISRHMNGAKDMTGKKPGQIYQA